MQRSLGRNEKLWDIGIYIILMLITLAILLPLWYVVATSVTPFDLWVKTGGTLFPTRFSFDAYRQLLRSGQLPRAFGVSVYITVLGTALSLVVTVLMAYPLAKRSFWLRTPLLLFVLFTLLFNGGLVPTYLVVRDLGLLNSYWALMLPNLVSGFNLLVMKSFFQGLPIEIEEAARIDGANEWQILWRVVLPLSRPILATIGLFYAVSLWNAFFDAILYISDAQKQPLQVVLRAILSSGNLAEFTDVSAASAVPTETLRMAAVVLTTIPILLVYPFLQRYFTAGVLLGSVKE